MLAQTICAYKVGPEMLACISPGIAPCLPLILGKEDPEVEFGLTTNQTV